MQRRAKSSISRLVVADADVRTDTEDVTEKKEKEEKVHYFPLDSMRMHRSDRENPSSESSSNHEDKKKKKRKPIENTTIPEISERDEKRRKISKISKRYNRQSKKGESIDPSGKIEIPVISPRTKDADPNLFDPKLDISENLEKIKKAYWAPFFPHVSDETLEDIIHFMRKERERIIAFTETNEYKFIQAMAGNLESSIAQITDNWDVLMGNVPFGEEYDEKLMAEAANKATKIEKTRVGATDDMYALFDSMKVLSEQTKKEMEEFKHKLKSELIEIADESNAEENAVLTQLNEITTLSLVLKHLSFISKKDLSPDTLEKIARLRKGTNTKMEELSYKILNDAKSNPQLSPYVKTLEAIQNTIEGAMGESSTDEGQSDEDIKPIRAKKEGKEEFGMNASASFPVLEKYRSHLTRAGYSIRLVTHVPDSDKYLDFYYKRKAALSVMKHLVRPAVGKIGFLKPVIMTGINNALTMLRRSYPSKLGQTTINHYIIDDDVRTTFATLAAKYCVNTTTDTQKRQLLQKTKRDVQFDIQMLIISFKTAMQRGEMVVFAENRQYGNTGQHFFGDYVTPPPIFA